MLERFQSGQLNDKLKKLNTLNKYNEIEYLKNVCLLSQGFQPILNIVNVQQQSTLMSFKSVN